MEQRVIFQWDHEQKRLRMDPHAPVCTREESMEQAERVLAIRGDDSVARETAKYEMALSAYALRDWYMACKGVPGGAAPQFLHAPTRETFDDIRQGIKLLKGASSERESSQIKDKYGEAQRAGRFMDYVLRVASVEAHNAGCCSVLLMAHAWLLAANPEGDAAAILHLRALLLNEYQIEEPAIGTTERHRQAEAKSKNFHWLSGSWRRLWESP